MTSRGHSALNCLAVIAALVLVFSNAALAQECGDVNGTNTVTASDALAVLNKAVGIDPGLVCAGDCAELEPRVAALESLLANVSVDGDSLVVTGMNVQIVDGTGNTDGEPNGLGNLIIGYNEATQGQTRTGSHNLVIGREHAYQSYGGVVAGYNNALGGAEASIVGGANNIATGARAAVLGGSFNTTSGYGSSVAGGLLNLADGGHATVSGGESNTASGVRSVLSGGLQRDVTGDNDWGAGSLFEED
jgi:hypothetical protein